MEATLAIAALFSLILSGPCDIWAFAGGYIPAVDCMAQCEAEVLDCDCTKCLRNNAQAATLEGPPNKAVNAQLTQGTERPGLAPGFSNGRRRPAGRGGAAGAGMKDPYLAPDIKDLKRNRWDMLEAQRNPKRRGLQ